MITTFRRSTGLAALATTALLGLAACSGSNSPHVASLNGSSGSGSDSTTTTLPKGNPTQLLDQWATCMRANGYPTIADPTIDANKVIHIVYPASTNGSGPASLNSNSTCGAYLTAASTALRGGKALQKPDPAKLEKYSECMRANGIPDFPDPSGGGLSIKVQPGSDLNPNNPTFQSASKLCAKKTGVPGLGSGTPTPGAIQATSGGPRGGPGGNGGSGSGSAGFGG